ncbi:Somatostatin receptor type 4 [Vulpes lagopus]
MTSSSWPRRPPCATGPWGRGARRRGLRTVSNLRSERHRPPRPRLAKLTGLGVRLASLLATQPLAVFADTKPARGGQAVACNLVGRPRAPPVLLGFLLPVLATGLCSLRIEAKMRVDHAAGADGRSRLWALLGALPRGAAAQPVSDQPRCLSPPRVPHPQLRQQLRQPHPLRDERLPLRQLPPVAPAGAVPALLPPGCRGC